MKWDEAAAWIVLAAVVGGVIWKIWSGHPHPPLSEEDRRDFDDTGE